MAGDAKAAQYKEAFALFDRKGQSKILCSDLGTVMRCLGLAPTNADLKNYITEFDAKDSGDIGFTDFMSIVQKHVATRSYTEEEVRESFKIFDKDGHGFIGTAELRHIMTNLGDKLSEEEVEDLLKMADTNMDGQIKYDDFVTLILPK